MVLPNQLTILRIILTPIFLYFFIYDDNTFRQISIIIFIVAALTDWYDGWLARKFNYITDWGKFMDSLADKILTAAAFIGLVILNVIELWMVVIILIRDFLVTGIRAYADYKNISFNTSKYAKVKTFFQMTVLYYLLIMFVLVNNVDYGENFKMLFEQFLNPTLVYFVMLAITLITVHSGFTYIKQNWVILKKLFNR